MLGATSIWLHNYKLKAIVDDQSKTFKEILERIKSRDGQYKCIDLRVRGRILTKEQLEQLNIALENNFIIGDIWWDEGQNDKNDKNNQDLKDEIEEKISRNINEYGLHATDFVHGLLSMHVYQDSKEGDGVILQNPVSKFTKKTKFTSEEENLWNQQLKGWKVQQVHNKNDSGYYGVLYKNKDTHQLVLAHRGTGSLKSVKADIAEVVSNSETIGQKGDTYDACKQAVKYANEHKYHLSVTGHSLGAWLAELSLYFIEHRKMNRDFRVKAVTFDSPGSSNIMEALKSNINNKDTLDTKNLNIVTYLSFPNIVNSFSKHTGKHYCLFPSFQKFNKEEQNIILNIIQSVSNKTAKITEIFEQLNTKLNYYRNVK